MQTQRIYFDNNATTAVAPEVKDAMLPFFEEHFGNPSSDHRFGEAAKNAVQEARERVAALINCRPESVVFVSGGSEANNMAIFSAASAYPDKRHIISSAVEHPSVLEPLNFLRARGYEVELLPVDGEGGLDLGKLTRAIRTDTMLVSLMAANNETGVIWPLEEIGGICKDRGVLFHCDAVQLTGKSEIDLERTAVDYLSVAGHKLHGPKGVGALFVRRSVPCRPLVMGAGQEGGRRAGTENVPGIVGLGKACELAGRDLTAYGKNVGALRNALEDGIRENIPDTVINGQGQPRLANTLSVSFRDCSSAAVIQELDEYGIAVSAQSACHSGDPNPSRVLSAMRVPDNFIYGTIRISLGRFNTREEVDRLLAVLPGMVAGSRAGAAL